MTAWQDLRSSGTRLHVTAALTLTTCRWCRTVHGRSAHTHPTCQPVSQRASRSVAASLEPGTTSRVTFTPASSVKSTSRWGHTWVASRNDARNMALRHLNLIILISASVVVCRCVSMQAWMSGNDDGMQTACRLCFSGYILSGNIIDFNKLLLLYLLLHTVWDKLQLCQFCGQFIGCKTRCVFISRPSNKKSLYVLLNCHRCY